MALSVCVCVAYEQNLSIYLSIDLFLRFESMYLFQYIQWYNVMDIISSTFAYIPPVKAGVYHHNPVASLPSYKANR